MYIVFHTLNKPNNNTRTCANSSDLFHLKKKSMMEFSFNWTEGQQKKPVKIFTHVVKH